jgi:hypothetical protein
MNKYNKKINLKQVTFHSLVTIIVLYITRIIRHLLPAKYITGFNLSLVILCGLFLIVVIFLNYRKSKIS